MAFGIIIKNRVKGSISKENRTEHRWEKRAKELSSGRHDGKCYTTDSIAIMMQMPERHINKMLKHETKDSEMVKDGKI